MKPVSHPSNTRTLQAPAGWDQGDVPVEPLGITDQLISSLPFIWSFWEPDAADRASIANGGKLVLSLLGRTMPPAMLMVEEPAANEAVTVALQTQVLAKLIELAKIVDRAVNDWGESQADGSSHVIFHKDVAEARDNILEFFDSLPENPDPSLLDSGPMKAERVAHFAPGQREANAAARDVLAERRRQVDVEGWTAEHDDSHVNDEIAALACFYAMPPGAREWTTKETGYGDTLGEAIRPEGWAGKVGDRRRELVKAAALAIAEIERLDREAARSEGDGHA
jgi:hypothetical protein